MLGDDDHPLTDSDVEYYVSKLKRVIKHWAEKYDLWRDCGFASYHSHFEEEPEWNPVALVLCTEGGLCRPDDGWEVDQDLDYEFSEVVWGLGFHCEDYDHCCRLFYAEEEKLKEACRRYFEWKWICSLVAPDYADLYEEIFAHFANDPAKLKQLPHRKFEVLLDGVFRNNGYRTQLGPGQGDGGVDLRLYHKDAIGDIVTLVQAKRYTNEPIRLEAVAALDAIVKYQRANRGLFVTTSRYLPVAKDFAARQSHCLELATSAEVAKWCELAATRIIRDKSELVTDDAIRSLVKTIKLDGTDPRIVCAHWGYNCVIIDDCIVLKETKTAALLMELPRRDVSGDGQMGSCVPVVDESITRNRSRERVFRALRKTREGKVYYKGRHRFYYQWDGTPQHFYPD